MLITNSINFLLFSGGILAALFVYAFYRAGWNKDIFMQNWTKAEGKKKIWKAVVAILGIPILFYLLLYSANAKAGEWFDGGTVFAGVDYVRNISPQCDLGGVNDQLTSNIGITQNVYRASRDVSINLKITHHSCALNGDRNGYDAGGLFVEVKAW